MMNNTILDSCFNGGHNFLNPNKRSHPFRNPYSQKGPKTQHYETRTSPINHLPIFPFNPNLVVPPLMPPPSSQQRANLYLSQPIVNSFLEGLISLSNNKQAPTAAEDPIGLQFDSAKLKLRHEIVISSLDGDLPRWEWHFRKTRNRLVKKKAKRAPVSRKYFPGVDANGRIINYGEEESEIEEKTFGVLADEDQRECQVCKEGFEELFCEEMNDWVYPGTAYLDATQGSTRALYKSLIGRIVHAKCVCTKQEIKSLLVSKGHEIFLGFVISS